MKGNRQFNLFILKAAALFVIWQVLYFFWINPSTGLEMWLTSRTAAVSTQAMQWVGYDAHYFDVPGETGNQSVSQIYLDGRPLLGIADSCNALTLIMLFVGFIIAYPGPLNRKIWFIVGGSLLIFFVNVTRALTLIFNFMYSKSTFDFNHKYTFTILVYLCVFGLWMLWAKRYGTNLRST
ncbi:MAG: archaeosortase/exosortase family protein [Catalinimonas sp.]